MKENFLPKNAALMFALTTSPAAITQFNQWELYFEGGYSKPGMQAGATSQTTFLDFSCKIGCHRVVNLNEKCTTFFRPATDYTSTALNIPGTYYKSD